MLEKKGVGLRHDSPSCPSKEAQCLTAITAIKDGGALHLSETSLSFKGESRISGNTAGKGGGGIIAMDRSSVHFANAIIFTYNWGANGGAIFFEHDATMTLDPNTTLTTSYNYAEEKGGAIYHRDAITPSQCEFVMNESKITDDLPVCFINSDRVLHPNHDNFMISSNYDSAGQDGGFLYGGLLDKCKAYTMTFVQ